MHGNAIIPPEHYEWLANLYVRTGVTLQDLGDQYGVTREAIRRIIALTDPDAAERKRNRRHSALAEKAWQAVADGAQWITEIADTIGVTGQNLHGHMRRYPDLYRGLSEACAENRRTRTEKACSACGETKPLTEFHKGGTADGHSARCKTCAIRGARKWYAQRPATPVPTVTEKGCPACNRTLPADRFYRATKISTGLQTYCKSCLSRMDKGESVRDIAVSYGHEYRRTRQKFGEAS